MGIEFNCGSKIINHVNADTYTHILEYLLKHGLNPNIDNGYLLNNIICANAGLDLIYLMLEYGADVTLIEPENFRHLIDYQMDDLLKLAAYGINFNQINNDNTINKCSSSETVVFLIKNGVEPIQLAKCLMANAWEGQC